MSCCICLQSGASSATAMQQVSSGLECCLEGQKRWRCSIVRQEPCLRLSSIDALFKGFMKLPSCSSRCFPARRHLYVAPVCNSVGNQPGHPCLLQVAKHNTAKNCWVSFLGGVYNVTPIVKDNGILAAPILKAAGTDISHWFDASTGDVKFYVCPVTNVERPYVPQVSKSVLDACELICCPTDSKKCATTRCSTCLEQSGNILMSTPKMS